MAAVSALFLSQAAAVRQALLQFEAEGGGRLVEALNHRESWSKRTPLEAACARGDAAVVKLLLRSGADVGAQRGSEPAALHLAVLANVDEEQKVELLEALLSGRWEGEGGEIISVAAATPSITCRKVLDGETFEDATPLYLAAFLGSLTAVDCLLRWGSNTRQAARLCLPGEQPMDDTPLEAARRRGVDIAVVQRLANASAAPPRAAPATPRHRPASTRQAAVGSSIPVPAAAAIAPAPLLPSSSVTSEVAGVSDSPAVLYASLPADEEVDEPDAAPTDSLASLRAHLAQLSPLDWSETYNLDGEELCKRDALVELVARFPSCSLAYSLLARDLPTGAAAETVLIPEIDELCPVGARELCIHALKLDDADLSALRTLARMSAKEPITMPYECGTASREQLCLEIVMIERGCAQQRRYSKAAGEARAARLAAEHAAVEEAGRQAAAREASERAKEAAAAAAAAAKEAELAEAARAAEAAEAATAHDMAPSVFSIVLSLEHGGVNGPDVYLYVQALQAALPPDATPVSIAVDDLLMCKLNRQQKVLMQEAAQLLQDIMSKPDGKNAVTCARACAAQEKFKLIFPPEVEGEEPPSDDAPRLRTLRLASNVPVACRPFIALAHLLADQKGTWADDAAAHLAAFACDLPSSPSPIAILALALQAMRRKELDKAAFLLYAFAHWGFSGGDALDPAVAGTTGCVAGWLSEEYLSVMREGFKRMAAIRDSPRHSDVDESGVPRDGPEADWAHQKQAQAKLPASERLDCPALDEIMTKFDGLRRVKEACLQLYIEVKQARTRARLTGTTVQQQLGDSEPPHSPHTPYHLVFLGNVRSLWQFVSTK